MERRRETRFAVKQPVRLTLLGEDPSGLRDVSFDGLVVDFSGRGMRLLVPWKVASGSAIRLDFENQLVLGEICYCQPTPDGRFVVGLQLEQSLSNLDDLTRLVRALIDGDSEVDRSLKPYSIRNR